MSDMIERAAVALVAFTGTPREWDALPRGAKEANRDMARAALLAALDPEDEALVEVLTARFLTDDDNLSEREAKSLALAALVALRETAQGVRAPEEPR